MLGGSKIMTSGEFEDALLYENFYNAMRGFIVIEESGLPKYIEFLTEEEIDVILLAGLLTGLQALAEVVSDERIKTIETSNSMFIFELRANYFYVIWIEKRIKNIEDYEPIILKIISRFEGASQKDIENALLISNLADTPEYEKIGRRMVKIHTTEDRYFDVYKKLEGESKSGVDINMITNELAGIDGVLVLSDDGEIHHSEFPRGEPIFNIEILRNFLVGLRKSIKNLDPGSLEEVTTQNYRFIIRDGEGFFYVYEVIKGLAKTEKLSQTMLKIMNRYEGLRRGTLSNFQILKDFDKTQEHELLGQLSLEMKERQNDQFKSTTNLKRQSSKMTFGDQTNNWLKEENQLQLFMDTYKEIFMAGIISPIGRFFVSKKTADINDWITSVNEMNLERLLTLIKTRNLNGILKMVFENKEIRVIKIKEQSVLFVVFDTFNLAAERFMIRLPKIFERISENIS